MYEEINRFIGHPDQGSNFDSLPPTWFGTDAVRRDGRGGQSYPNVTRSNATVDWGFMRLMGIYRRVGSDAPELLKSAQLKDSADAQYVRSFEMRNDRDVTDYYLFYATNSILGTQEDERSDVEG